MIHGFNLKMFNWETACQPNPGRVRPHSLPSMNLMFSKIKKNSSNKNHLDNHPSLSRTLQSRPTSKSSDAWPKCWILVLFSIHNWESLHFMQWALQSHSILVKKRCCKTIDLVQMVGNLAACYMFNFFWMSYLLLHCRSFENEISWEGPCIEGNNGNKMRMYILNHFTERKKLHRKKETFQIYWDNINGWRANSPPKRMKEMRKLSNCQGKKRNSKHSPDVHGR